MQKAIYNYLSKYYDDADRVDRLIVCAFMAVNEMPPTQNILLNSYAILPESDEGIILKEFIEVIRQSQTSLDFEHLIELFEFVVSPSDKVVNGAVYTPKNIRDYIVRRCINPEQAHRLNYKVADIACGCGGGLLAATQTIKALTQRSIRIIFSA